MYRTDSMQHNKASENRTDMEPAATGETQDMNQTGLMAS